MANKATGSIRKPYVGERRALVLALDVGTTFSGVSYAFLEPGEVPKIHGVTRYPGQEHVTGNTKIPSILYYDRHGAVKAAGAEAEGSQIEALAEDEDWSRVELFKLRLRPRQMELDMNGMKLTPLPAKKSSEAVFGDFLRYLFSCSRKFIEDTHANGANLWKAVEKDTHFVLSHPNGWEGAQQSRMRRAAILGGLIPDNDEGKARIRFVTEGEASMHACILSGLAADVLSTGNGFIVADAGGGTLDVSSYVLKGTHPLIIEEVAPPDCLFAGAVFVSRRARVFLEEKLKGSKYGTPDALDHITKKFDETTKRLFRDKNDAQYIPFGSPLDKDQKVGIRGGQLKLSGTEVAELFEPSIQAAVACITKQYEASRGVVKAVWLVGGFAASPWLFSQLQGRLKALNITVNRPDTQTSKAVADGAIGFFCDHHVSARISKFMYGVEYLREIDLQDEDHVSRQGRILQLPSGPRYLPDAFDCILNKGVRVKESSVFSRKYYTEVTKVSTLSVFEIEVWCFRGGDEVPKWIDRSSPFFGSLCFVRADLSKLSNTAEPKTGPDGKIYWTVAFAIEIHFGLTEFKARMKYNEDGKTRFGPATIIFNEKGVRSDEDDTYSIADDDNVAKPRSRHPKPKSSTTSRSSTASVDTVRIESAASTSSTKSKSRRKEDKEKAASAPVSPGASRAGSALDKDLIFVDVDAGVVIPSRTPSKAPSVTADAPPPTASADAPPASSTNAPVVSAAPAMEAVASNSTATAFSATPLAESVQPSPTDTVIASTPTSASPPNSKDEVKPAEVESKPEVKAEPVTAVQADSKPDASADTKKEEAETVIEVPKESPAEAKADVKTAEAPDGTGDAKPEQPSTESQDDVKPDASSAGATEPDISIVQPAAPPPESKPSDAPAVSRSPSIAKSPSTEVTPAEKAEDKGNGGTEKAEAPTVSTDSGPVIPPLVPPVPSSVEEPKTVVDVAPPAVVTTEPGDSALKKGVDETSSITLPAASDEKVTETAVAPASLLGATTSAANSQTPSEESSEVKKEEVISVVPKTDDKPDQAANPQAEAKGSNQAKGKQKKPKGPTPPKKGKGKANSPPVSTAPSAATNSEEKEKKKDDDAGMWGSGDHDGGDSGWNLMD